MYRYIQIYSNLKWSIINLIYISGLILTLLFVWRGGWPSTAGISNQMDPSTGWLDGSLPGQACHASASKSMPFLPGCPEGIAMRWMIDDLSGQIETVETKQGQPPTVDGSEIPNNHLGCIKNPVNNGINYQPQLVQDFSHQQQDPDFVVFFVLIVDLLKRKKYVVPKKMTSQTTTFTFFLGGERNLGLIKTQKTIHPNMRCQTCPDL